RPRDRLPIRDDRQGLERRRGELRRSHRRKQLPNPSTVSRVAHQLPALRFFRELERAPLLDVLDFQLLERRGDLRLGRLCKLVRHELVFPARAFDRGHQLAGGERFLRGEQERFDDLRETHRTHVTYTTYSPIALWIASAIWFACDRSAPAPGLR